MKKAIMMLGAAMALTACQAKQTTENDGKKKSLVVYYSQTGATAKVANLLAEQTGADIDSIVAVNPYDGDFGQTISRCQKEMQSGELPELKALSRDIANYDTLYIGCPVWFGTMAPPMKSYLKDAKLDGKVVIPFVTFGSGGLETTVADMKVAAPKANFLNAESYMESADGKVGKHIIGYGVRNARVDKAADEIKQFLIDIKAKEGKASEKLSFGKQTPLTDADKKIFEEACSGYQMPLGTPVSTSSCKRQDGTTVYLFVVESTDATGKPAQAVIHVVKKDGARAEFTKVVR